MKTKEMMIEKQDTQALPIAEMRSLVADLFASKPSIYWCDFLVTILVGYACFELVDRLAIWMPNRNLAGIAVRAVCFVASCLLFYRAAIFVHELTHLRRGSFRAFRVCWNLLCGIPFLMPSFTYYPHLVHHRKSDYGTELDGEYLPLRGQNKWLVVLYLLSSLIVPFLAVLRFLILAPLGWMIPSLRRWLLAHGSTLVMNPRYVRPPETGNAQVIFLQEFLCFCWCVSVTFIITYIEPAWFWPFLIQAYATAVVVVTLNCLRTLGAHRFQNSDGEQMTLSEQVEDSLNYEGNALLRELWAPLGLSFHALHHLFPGLPYHALPEAHRRLVRELPPNCPYHATRARSLFIELMRRAR